MRKVLATLFSEPEVRSSDGVIVGTPTKPITPKKQPSERTIGNSDGAIHSEDPQLAATDALLHM